MPDDAPVAAAAAGEGSGPAVGSIPEVDAGLPESPTTPPPWELLRPLAIGSVLTEGWRLAGLDGAVDGSCVLTLQNRRGRAQRVHLCRNDGQPQGLVFTKRFDMVVMNGGRGDLPTEEGLGRAVAEVAHVVAANEGDPRAFALATVLLPQAERERQFAGGIDRKLR
jgi:hypothetical protein